MPHKYTCTHINAKNKGGYLHICPMSLLPSFRAPRKDLHVCFLFPSLKPPWLFLKAPFLPDEPFSIYPILLADDIICSQNWTLIYNVSTGQVEAGGMWSPYSVLKAVLASGDSVSNDLKTEIKKDLTLMNLFSPSVVHSHWFSIEMSPSLHLGILGSVFDMGSLWYIYIYMHFKALLDFQLLV